MHPPLNPPRGLPADAAELCIGDDFSLLHSIETLRHKLGTLIHDVRALRRPSTPRLRASILASVA
jgi:hypothetical protein